MDEYNSHAVTPTLKQVVRILESNDIEYRFLGSVVVAAINGKQHRDLGDLDLIIDSKGKDILYSELTNMGYMQARGMFSFARRYLALETLDHKELLGVGFFYGKWQTDGSFVLGDKNTNVKIDALALKPTHYNLHGVSFIGIPPEAIATGIKTSAKNPKRKKELLLLQDKRIDSLPNSYIHVNVFGIKADWVYHLSMTTLGAIGAMRVRLGLAFDPWR